MDKTDRHILAACEQLTREHGGDLTLEMVYEAMESPPAELDARVARLVDRGYLVSDLQRGIEQTDSPPFFRLAR